MEARMCFEFLHGLADISILTSSKGVDLGGYNPVPYPVYKIRNRIRYIKSSPVPSI